MTSPATLSLADLAAAVVAIKAHRKGSLLYTNGYAQIVHGEPSGLDVIIAAANRLPAVVARVEALEAFVRKQASISCNFLDDGGCPSFGGHVCVTCRARAFLAALETP